MDTKVCSKCHQALSTADFYRHKYWRDGYHPWCKSCARAAGRARYERRCVEHPPAWRWNRDAIRHEYFADVTAPLQAFILGLLAADGNVLASVPRITLELAMKDAELPELVRHELAPLHPIRERVRKTIANRHGTSHMGTISFTSARMVSDLARFGIVPAKTLGIRWPSSLSPVLARDYILGYFDGDGFITYTINFGHRYEIWGLTSGSCDFLRDVIAVILEQTGITLHGPTAKGANSQAYHIRVVGSQALRLDQWLHANCAGLARKRIAR